MSFEVNLLRYSDPDRKHLAHAAAVYLGKPDTSNVRRPLTLVKKRDALNIFRGESARFEIKASKVVYDHLVTYTTANMRACGGLRANRATEFVLPPEIPYESPLYADIEKVGNAHLAAYLDFANGIDPATQEPTEKMRLQAARAVAPMSVKLHFIIEFNFATLAEALFPQRIWTPGAQLDTYQVALEMFRLVHETDRELWDTFYNYYGPDFRTWAAAYGKLMKEDPAQLRSILEKYPMKSMWG
ncbi:FAD-dependent thymidylate synthase [Paenibacillus sp. L3-i20]|uniref:FAD-dependent thymidylate synthase n=1 Tax=Paenibacillus sp. L3-i20 TaxID=2905833 RepID=UPI001EDD08C0|nr:FAD-dependent thymidylate synthase [Paenibacillus sp. L3-i20]GKU79328.1 hypothetical protein L3i20_v237250 [Paenibacillus sp. L3-i20]